MVFFSRIVPRAMAVHRLTRRIGYVSPIVVIHRAFTATLLAP
jgi:hypothetical protein